jgi:hypothetical protein
MKVMWFTPEDWLLAASWIEFFSELSVATYLSPELFVTSNKM